ncbi:putative Mob1/phocein family protein [Rhypophila decipiens]|uniref:Mob1/phocein family protein n=1 Tax=Rhypophila decipiens TaxID=261697 RepID=A0AAN7BA28_9PEZI|nr:putative Mob1/phocein family protein [Rhypophila decipiens]
MMSLAPSSPRLPSPPPPAEIQIGPKSPSMGPAAARQAQQMEQTVMDANSKRRIHPGTRAADMAAGPPLIPLQELDSAFQLQEHLAALHYYHTVSNTSPVTRETAKMLAAPPPGTDKTLWLYELCRFLIGQCNSLIVGFLFDTPPCSAATCPEMRASEWQFLCAVHDQPKSCCAIDYCCHTLDWAANVVTNAKIFPSRFVVDSHDKTTALKNLVNVFRRLHRIFAHAWFQHRGVFWSVEGQTGLYVFFKTVCDVYDLLPGENYKLPPEAEGLESFTSPPENGGSDTKQHGPTPILLTKTSSQRMDLDDQGDFSAGRTNTKRHIKSSPSTGSAVGTVLEADEDDTSDVANRMKQMQISEDGQSDEGMNVPVIVEHTMVDQPPLRPPTVIPISDEATKVSEIESIPGEEVESPVPTPEVETITADHQQFDDKQPSEAQDSEEKTEPTQGEEPAAEEIPPAEPTIPDRATQEEEIPETPTEEQQDQTDVIANATTGGKDEKDDDDGPLPDEITVEIKSLPEEEPAEPVSSSLSTEDSTGNAGPPEVLEKEKEKKEGDETEQPFSAEEHEAKKPE